MVMMRAVSSIAIEPQMVVDDVVFFLDAPNTSHSYTSPPALIVVVCCWALLLAPYLVQYHLMR